MSDVERICEVNQERRRWAEEYDEKRCCQHGGQGSGRPTDHRNDKRGDKMRRVMRAGSLVCAMVTGAGAAFLGMGISMQHHATILVGSVIAAVFLLAGSVMEMEEER